MPPNVVKRAAEFCSTPKFERIFDDFARSVHGLAPSLCSFWWKEIMLNGCGGGTCRDNADAFTDAVEAKDGEVEHKHE